MRKVPVITVVVLLVLTGGCMRTPVTPKEQKQAQTPAHDHPDKGPHGGVLAEWGDEEYHAEFTADRNKKEAVVYILDGTGRKAAAIDAATITLSLTHVNPPVSLTLKADPQKRDPDGKSSRFRAVHEALGSEKALKGEIGGQVGGTPFAGSFEQKK